MDGPSVHFSKWTTDAQIPLTWSMWWTDLDGGPSYYGEDGRKWTDIFGGRSTSWTDSDGGPRNLVKDGRRWTGFLSGPSTPWTDSDGGPRFFLVSGRRWTGFLSGPSTSWTDSDGGRTYWLKSWTEVDDRTDGRSPSVEAWICNVFLWIMIQWQSLN